jgi:hypothetical protein
LSLSDSAICLTISPLNGAGMFIHLCFS